MPMPIRPLSQPKAVGTETSSVPVPPPVSRKADTKTQPKARRQAARKGVLRQEALDIRRSIAEVEITHPRDLLGQLGALWPKIRLTAACGRQRPASVSTEDGYYHGIGGFIKELGKLNVRPPGLSYFTVKHLRMAFASWEKRGISASYLQQCFTTLRRFFTWIGQPSVPALRSMLANPDRATRTTSAVVPKTWSSKGVDPDEVIERMKLRCPATAMHLAMERCWGLRVQEGLCINVFAADGGDTLLVNRGTKGGLGRFVPLDTDVRRDLLKQAQLMANPRTGLVQADPRMTLKQARNHYYYMVRSEGLTGSSAGVTSHGLRHEYANDRFLEATGEPSPVLGGNLADRAREKAARAQLTRALGHSRTQITTAYTGSVQQMRRMHTRNLIELVRMVEDPEGPAYRLHLAASQAAAAASQRLRLYLLDDHGPGTALYGPSAPPLLLAVQFEPGPSATLANEQPLPEMDCAMQKFNSEIITALGKLLDTQVAVVSYEHVRPATSMIELFGARQGPKAPAAPSV